jgi:hypothetical protein
MWHDVLSWCDVLFLKAYSVTWRVFFWTPKSSHFTAISGLRGYFKKYAFGNTTLPQFLQAVAAQSTVWVNALKLWFVTQVTIYDVLWVVGCDSVVSAMAWDSWTQHVHHWVQGISSTVYTAVTTRIPVQLLQIDGSTNQIASVVVHQSAPKEHPTLRTHQACFALYVLDQATNKPVIQETLCKLHSSALLQRLTFDVF